jgi:hypothetical protein
MNRQGYFWQNYEQARDQGEAAINEQLVKKEGPGMSVVESQLSP